MSTRQCAAKVLKQSFVKLGISTSQYFAKSFGGSLEGNQCQKLLDDARNENFIILEALGDKPEAIEKYKEALTCLANVDKMLKVENDNMTDTEVAEIKQECEKWGKIWPNKFSDVRKALVTLWRIARTYANVCEISKIRWCTLVYADKSYR